MSNLYEDRIQALEKENLKLRQQSIKNAGRAIAAICTDLQNGDMVVIEGKSYRVEKKLLRQPVLRRIYKAVKA